VVHGWCSSVRRWRCTHFILQNVRRDYILPFNKERRDVTGNITLYLSILSSAFQLKTPLPPYLPPVETSRQTLVDAIKKLEPTRSAEVQGSKQLLFFAYAMTMKGVTQELEVLGKTLQDAFGVIGQVREHSSTLDFYAHRVSESV
jgi:hypothetical protein